MHRPEQPRGDKPSDTDHVIHLRESERSRCLGEHEQPDAACDLDVPAMELSAGESSCATSVGYLMHCLIHEEYWKRAWIIQEIGMAEIIHVRFGKKSIPWRDFLALVKWYQEGSPTDQMVQNVLKLGRLRESRRRDGKTYFLTDLLNTFRNSFCSVVHDKIYAFLSLAIDHSREIGINYSKTIFELYQDVIAFQSGSTSESSEKQIETVYLSALVRRILSRESGKQPKKAEYIVPNNFMSSHKIWANWYVNSVKDAIARNEAEKDATRLACKIARQTSCGEVARQQCLNSGYDSCEDSVRQDCKFSRRVDCNEMGDDNNEVLVAILGYMLFYPLIHTWIAVSDWLTILDMRKKTEFTTFWYPTDPEDIDAWQPRLPEYGIPGIQIRGSIVGQVGHIGPLQDDILASFNAKKQWTASLSNHFSNKSELTRVRGQNERLMHILKDPSGVTTRNIQDFPEGETGKNQQGPRLFLGTSFIAGIIPPGAMVGDTICQFWNSSASAVLRKDVDGVYQVIGRAGLVQHGESSDWDVPLDRGIFDDVSERAVDLVVDIMTLTRLSLDTVHFPFST